MLRRSGRDEVPGIPALIAAEVPILAIEAALAVIASYTLVGPLGLPWWAPLVGFAVAVALVLGLRRLAGRGHGLWAGLAVLRRLTPDVYEELERRGARLEAGLAEAAPGAHVQRVGAMATLFLHDGPVRDFDAAAASDAERYGALFRHLLERGIYVAPSQFEAMFLSLAHGDEEIDRTVEAVADFFAG